MESILSGCRRPPLTTVYAVPSACRVHGGDVLYGYPVASSSVTAPTHPLSLGPRPQRHPAWPPRAAAATSTEATPSVAMQRPIRGGNPCFFHSPVVSSAVTSPAAAPARPRPRRRTPRRLVRDEGVTVAAPRGHPVRGWPASSSATETSPRPSSGHPSPTVASPRCTGATAATPRPPRKRSPQQMNRNST